MHAACLPACNPQLTRPLWPPRQRSRLPSPCLCINHLRLSADAIAEFHIANNDFEGDLSALAGSHLSTVTVHENPKLCGMVPSSVRYAKGYNPAGTALGQPCPA